MLSPSLPLEADGPLQGSGTWVMAEPTVEEIYISGLILKTTCYLSEILIYIVLGCGVGWLFITALSLVWPIHNLRLLIFWALPTSISSFIHYPFPSCTTILPQWITMISQTHYVPLDFRSITVMLWCFSLPHLLAWFIFLHCTYRYLKYYVHICLFPLSH